MSSEESRGRLAAPDGGVVLVKGIAGLGNRILSLLTALLYARLAGRRLVVDWSDEVYSADGRNAFPRLLEFSPGLAASPGELDSRLPERLLTSASVAPPLWRGWLHESPVTMLERWFPDRLRLDSRCAKALSIDVTRLDHPEEVVVVWSFFDQVHRLRRHFTGEFRALRSRDDRRILGELLQHHLRPAPAVAERSDRFEAERFHRPTAGVHVRYTDKRTPLGPVHRRIRHLLDHTPGLQIFLATDSLQVRNDFERRYAGVITAEKWYSPSGKPLHRDGSRPDRLEEGIAALVDIRLLAACDYLIVDESSAFSYVARLLRTRGAEGVFNVQRGRWLPSELRRWLWRRWVRVAMRPSRSRAVRRYLAEPPKDEATCTDPKSLS